MKKKPEYILCAAIWYKDEKQLEHDVTNIDCGMVLCGRRHHNVIDTYFTLTGKTTKNKERCVQGFLTSENRFVDRKEGFVIAQREGQLLHGMTDKSNPILISEDLY